MAFDKYEYLQQFFYVVAGELDKSGENLKTDNLSSAVGRENLKMDIMLYAVKNPTRYPQLYETLEKAEKFARDMKRGNENLDISIEVINAWWLKNSKWSIIHGE